MSESYSLTGEYDSDTDTETIEVTYGHSKAKRPDLKQVIQELVTTQDGGIPFVTKTWSGNASDSIILRERAKALIEDFSTSSKRYLVADSKLYASETAETLNRINFITRVPATLKLEQSFIEKAYESPHLWLPLSTGYKAQEFVVDNFDINNQRWIVVHSEQARDRIEKTLKKEVTKELEVAKKALFHLKAQQFSCKTDAQKELLKIAKKWKYHQVCEQEIVPITCSEGRGRPTGQTVRYEWKIAAKVDVDSNYVNQVLEQRSCFVLATNISASELPIDQVLIGYKGQDKPEKSFAFLKSPEVFVSSLYVKKPSRIEGLLMIMVLSLLVYSLAQRRLRQQLVALNATLPNQIKKQVQNPTMRWIFQLLEGINYVTVTIDGVTKYAIEGLTSLRQRIIGFLSPGVQSIYQNSYAHG